MHGRVTLQAFNGSSALTALLVSAAVAQRDQTQSEIARACTLLADMVATATAGDRRPRLPDRAGEPEEDGGRTE
ncbi:hypothetical protein AB0I68_19885 [Streptomyces sp. NPDC050448]|uniref:hypothetical protein n=1 Tax=Streptomyces sp. NPDC050448 TaxID=3155404 RepID=UPI0034311D65